MNYRKAMRRNIFITLFIASFLALCCGAATVSEISLDTRLVPDSPVKAIVISPEGYPRGTQFPTVYLLHGFGDDYKGWSTRTQPKLAELADKYGMIMVMPDGRDSWYWDSPANPEMKMESFIITELVPYVDMNYPTIRSSEKRAITGLSMGGQGAMYLAMRHPDVFGNVGSTSGGLDIRDFPKSWKMANWLGAKAANEERWDAFAIPTLAKKLKPGELNIIFDCGTDDFFFDVNERLHRQLLDDKIPHDYISRPGNHSHPYWRNAILYQLLFFNEAFK